MRAKMEPRRAKHLPFHKEHATHSLLATGAPPISKSTELESGAAAAPEALRSLVQNDAMPRVAAGFRHESSS